ncbi:uncharacterized protein LOC128960137 [Oppia nitens]|uniref:uncharacterized protein LOC128960137 n=1 Tax=Oppia nitens TaxID=1686743 RepID=UPI0023DC213C|nr:uncharacterized protein LOC128960137 [Oppia nitens]
MKYGINWNNWKEGDRKIWKEIPQEKYFVIDYENNIVKFQGLINNEQITTSSLVSQWINWNKTLLSVPLKYEISVDNSEDFDGFRVRPQLCDWLFRCRDGTIVSTDNDDKKRIFSVTFAPIDDITRYVKLHFQVDYFRPSYAVRTETHIENSTKNYISKFNLKLIHFGDPCFGELQNIKCKGNYDKCITSEYPDNNRPNDPQCECKPEYIQDIMCNKINYCYHIYDKIKTINMSGRKYCQKQLNIKGCHSVIDDFKCYCGTNDVDKINWNSEKHICEQISFTGNWDKTTDPNKYIAPANQTNKLTFNLTPVLWETSDICIYITYTIPIKFGLKLDILYEENNLLIPSLFLPKTISSQKFQLCLNDYIPNLPEKFSLSFVAPNNLDKNDLTLDISANLQNKSLISNTFITNWNAMLKSEKDSQMWTQLPKSDFGLFDNMDELVRTKMTYHFTVSKDQQKTSHQLISPWIIYDDNFKLKPTYSFTIEFDDNNDKIGQSINVYLLYQSGNKTILDHQWTDSGKGRDTQKLYKPEFTLNNIKGSAFKLIIQFEFNDNFDFTKKSSYPITISDINIGDYCYKDDKTTNCIGGQCIRDKPNSFICQCLSKIKGKFCDEIDECLAKSKIDGLTNNDYCNLFANAKCQHLSIKSFECLCPQPYYQWNQNQLICEQKTFAKRKSKTCDTGDFFGDNLSHFAEHSSVFGLNLRPLSTPSQTSLLY